ncbi:MAG: flagellar basal-body MS-ring/collar protein FliF, partial [bacterium]
RRQIIFVSIALTTVVVVGALLYWAMQPQYVVLYNRDLAPKEASKIAEELRSMGVQPKIEAGNIIKVPFGRVHELRLQLAQSGIQPSSTTGFEIFEKGGIGITDFERQMRFKRALEGSLIRSIKTNPQVKDAQLNLTIPKEEALFESDEKPVTGSLVLQLKPFAQLKDQQIQGIVNIVTFGVQKLDPKNFRVMDQKGNTLWEGNQAADSRSGEQMKQLKVKRQIEDKLEDKIHSSLGQVLTRDRLAAAVTINMNFDRVEEKMIKRTKPEGSFEQLRKKEKTTSRSLKGEDLKPGGQAGVESNIPGGEEVKGNVTNYQEEADMVEYFANKSVTEIVQSPALSRVSAVLTVDGNYEKTTDDQGNIKYEYKELPEEKVQKIRQLAKAAIGYNSKRGDKIEVAQMQFDRSDEFQKRKQRRRQEAFQRKLIYFVLGAIALTFIIGGGLYWWRQRMKKRTTEEAEEAEPEIPTRDLMAEVSIEEKEREQLKDQIRESAQEDPETTAQILRSWFAEEMS